MKKAVLLVNVGTPDKPEVGAVRRYLGEFLNDPMVIDLPWLARKLLVNGVIIPFRAKKSTALYQRLWTPEGSPLLVNLHRLVSQLQQSLPVAWKAYGAMRYGHPSMETMLNRIVADGAGEIVVFPLYPQYASSTTGSAEEEVNRITATWKEKPLINITGQFYKHPAFIRAFTARIRAYNPETFDHIIFSYHGLPVRHVVKMHPEVPFETCHCEAGMPVHGKFCYKATCYETTRLLADSLSIPVGKYTVGFQSRLSKNWLTPFTDHLLIQLAQQGVKNVLVVAPSFVADCLETLIEIREEYREHFIRNGGENLVLVDSLNDSEEWAQAIAEIISASGAEQV
jgi:protoporphyrin/coproporphyrin ferrochelatase